MESGQHVLSKASVGSPGQAPLTLRYSNLSNLSKAGCSTHCWQALLVVQWLMSSFRALWNLALRH